MLDDPTIDVVYSSFPNSLHTEWSIKALNAGKHVLCEKPLATTLEEVDQIQSAVQETGKHLAEAFMYRHHLQTIKVKELVDSGILGRLRLVKGEFTFSIKNEEDVRLDPDLGGGSIWDIGCYPISYARFILGDELREVFGWQKSGDSGVDEGFVGQMRFAGDVFAQFDSGFRSPYRSRIEIVGYEASMIIPSPFNPGMSPEIQIDRGGEIESIAMPQMELYTGDSRNNVRSILGLLYLAELGQPVSLS